MTSQEYDMIEAETHIAYAEQDLQKLEDIKIEIESRLKKLKLEVVKIRTWCLMCYVCLGVGVTLFVVNVITMLALR